MYRMTAKGLWLPEVMVSLPKSYYAEHRDWLSRFVDHPLEEIRAELRGKDLCCWCGLESKCHADILIELANA